MTDPASSLVGHTKPLSARVEERIVGPCRVLMVKTSVQDVVSWQGAILTLPDIAAGERLVQGLTVQMLDKGTLVRDRFAIAEALEDRGAHIQFSSDALRVSFQGRALQADVPDVLRIMAEELRQPLFDADEFMKTSAQYKAGLQRSMENTAMQAVIALSQLLYNVDHPNYRWSAQEGIERLDQLTLEQIRAYHAKHFGARELLLVFVGDIDYKAIEQAVRDAFGDWSVQEAQPAFRANATLRPPGRRDVLMPGKPNVDVRMGHVITIRRPDPDYIPLYLASYILGGNFSARLMTKVRDEMGLTYGIHTRLSSITREYGGHWGVGVTLSRENIEKGLTATLDVVNQFVEEGPTPDELRDKQTTITGRYQVGMATTSGLASTLYLQALRGFDVEYIDRFSDEVKAVRLSQVRDAIHRHFNPEAYQMAFAGELPDDAGGPL